MEKQKQLKGIRIAQLAIQYCHDDLKKRKRNLIDKELIKFIDEIITSMIEGSNILHEMNDDIILRSEE